MQSVNRQFSNKNQLFTGTYISLDVKYNDKDLSMDSQITRKTNIYVWIESIYTNRKQKFK